MTIIFQNLKEAELDAMNRLGHSSQLLNHILENIILQNMFVERILRQTDSEIIDIRSSN